MNTLALRLAHALSDRAKSPAELARAIGKTESAVSQWLSGETKSMRSDNLMAVSNFLGVNVSWLATGGGEMDMDSRFDAQSHYGRPARHPEEIDLENNPEYPAIRRVKLKAQAGASGYAVEYSQEDDGPPIVFRADWYKLKGYRPEKMLALRVKGESMIPSLYEDDLIVINTLSTTPKQGIPFLVSYEGEICVKRLVRDEGLWWLMSDNPDQRRYPRTKCNGGTEIIGEVVYRQTERV